MKPRATLGVVLSGLAFAACSQVQPESNVPVAFADHAVANFHGLGVATLPTAFDAERRRGSRVESFTARDAELRDTLMTMFKDSDVNLLIDEAVAGRASFDIKAASLEETFEALLESYDLAYRWDGNFLRIEDVATRVFDVDYPGQSASAGGSVGSSSEDGGGGDDGASESSEDSFWDRLESDLVTVAGNSSRIIVNRRLGTVGIEGKPKTIARVGQYLEQARRRATRQVSIEARIVEVSLKKEFKAGVDWSLLPGFFNSSKTGSLSGGGMVGQSAAAGVDLFQFGLVNAGDFSVFLDALEVQGQVRVLSSPRVATLHNVPAQIRVVEQVPVIEREIIDTDSASRTQFSVRFEDAGVTVGVTPQIGEDGHVTCHIRPSIVEVSGFVTTPDKLVSEPILNTRSVTTILRVPDGQPIVLGGLRSERKTETLSKVPLLGDVPILGNLFRTTVQERADTELVILLTPRILTPAWEREDLRRSLDRIRRVRESFRPSTIPMSQNRIDLETFALDDRGALEEEEQEKKRRRVAQSATKTPSAREIARKDRRLTRNGLAQLALRRALRAMDRGDVSFARGSLEQAIDLDADYADAWLVVASIEFGRGRIEAARSAYQRVLKLRPQDAHAEIGLGLIAHRSGNPLHAERIFRGILERGESPEARNNLGVTLLAQGRVTEAKEAFARAVQAAPSLVEASLNMAVCHDRSDEHRQALEAYRSFVRAGGRLDDPRLQGMRAHIETVMSKTPSSEGEPVAPMQ